MLNDFTQNITDELFRKYKEKVFVFLRSSKTANSADFDPDFDTTHTVNIQNPITVKAIVRQTNANSLIIRDIGLAQTGAIEIIVKDNDANTIKLSEKLTYNGIEYTVFNKALGNRIQIFDLTTKFSKIILFRVR